MSYKLTRLKHQSFRAATAGLIAGALALSPAYLAAQDSADQQAESQASKEQRYKAHLAEGSKAYKNKNFDKALEELQAAHDIDPRPSILFNMGLISEKKGDLEGAAGYYRKFIGAPDVGLSARKRASERLAVVNEIIDQSDNSEAGQATTDLMPALEAMNADFEEMGAGEKTADVSTGQQASQAGDQEAKKQQAQPQQNDSAAQNQNTTNSPVVVDNSGSSNALTNVDYGWEPYAAYSVGTGAIIGGVVALALYNTAIHDAQNTAEGTTLHEQHERNASDYLTMAGGMFITGGVLVGLGTYYIVSTQAEHAKANDDASSTTVSVGADYVGVKYSLDF